MSHSAAFVLGVGAVAVTAVVLLSLANKHIGAKTGGAVCAATQKKAVHLYRVGCSQGVQARQDKNPVIALVHVATAKAYLDAAQHVAGGKTVLSGGVDTCVDVREKIADTTRAAMKAIAQKYPKLAVSGAEHFTLGAGWVV